MEPHPRMSSVALPPHGGPHIHPSSPVAAAALVVARAARSVAGVNQVAEACCYGNAVAPRAACSFHAAFASLARCAAAHGF